VYKLKFFSIIPAVIIFVVSCNWRKYAAWLVYGRTCTGLAQVVPQKKYIQIIIIGAGTLAPVDCFFRQVKP
jgi:hypothetical protein